MTFIEPQLAETADQKLDRYDDGAWYAENKIDGERLGIRVTEDGMVAWSRLAIARTLPPHLEQEIRRLPPCYLDAEVYVPGGRSWDVKASKNSHKLRLAAFDMLEVIGHNICPMPQSERTKYLETACEPLGEHSPISVAKRMTDHTTFQSFYDKVVKEEGGEGIMLKRFDSPYRPGYRSQAWLKVKQNIEVVLTCIDFKEGTTKGLLSVARLALPNGGETTVKSRTYKDAQDWTARPASFIGRSMEVEAQCWTPDGSLRHPRMLRWAGPHE